MTGRWGSIAAWRLRVPSRKVRGRRGTVATMVGLAAIPMTLMVGLAIDGTRLWLLQTRLQAAVDASALLAAGPSEASLNPTTSPSDASKIASDASNLFWADFGRVSRTVPPVPGACGTGSPSPLISTGFMGATVCDNALSVTYPDATHVQVTTTAGLPMTFMGLAGISTGTVSATAIAQQAGGVEVALVLDISLSMALPMGDGTGNLKEKALQIAAGNMLSALYNGQDTVPNLFISVVPFAGAVNIGNSHTSWLDSSFTTSTFKGSTADGSGWRGCVEARQNGLDLMEDSPAAAPFAPFYWPTTLNQYANGANPPYPGDNDWATGKITDLNSSDQTGNSSTLVGPNLGCPHSAILPLTASKATVSSAISNFTLTNPIGTVVVQGLQWGWFTLSPSWKGSSGWNVTTTGGTPLPLNYTAPNNKKVIVLMTDGTSDVSGAQTFYGKANKPDGTYGPNCNAASNPPMAPDCIPANNGAKNAPKVGSWAGTDADSWYSPYGRVSANRVDTMPPPPPNPPSPAVRSEQATQDFSKLLDDKVTTLCTKIKQKGIFIYTIFFHGSQDDFVDAHLGSQKGTFTAKTILQGCATDNSHFFDATSSASISNAFVQIAKQIAALRLTH